MPLTGQQIHQRCVRPGPLVLGTNPLNSPTPAADRDRTVSRRSEPSSRTALMGEQPNPWDLLQPQDATSRHRGAKPGRRCGLLGPISLLSPEYLYPLSDGASTCYRRITKACFRTCSTCQSRSQAPLCLYTLRTISNRAEGTFARLRYILGGDRPSQTTHLALFSARIHGALLEIQYIKGGISRLAPQQPQPLLQSLPPILSEMHRTPIPGCSKGSRGLSVQPRVLG